MKLCIVTTTRAEYGLLRPLIKELRKDRFFDVQLIATGTHLSRLHGMTINQIVRDGITINESIPIDCSDSTESGVLKTLSDGITAFSALLDRKNYDALIVLGDRTELMAICLPALIHKIPIVHIHGGELTCGATDNSIRHAVTKLASVHFASTEPYRKRIIQLGENPSLVFNVGALGIDNIVQEAVMQKFQLFSELGIDRDFALVTFHPATTDNQEQISAQADILIDFLLKLQEISVITMPNSDFGSGIISGALISAQKKHPKKLFLYKNLGQKLYINAMRHASLMIGNSSSGVIEASYLSLPVINIGDRQEGRIKPDNVIDCVCELNSLLGSYKHINSAGFRDKIKKVAPPFGKGKAATEITRILKSINFSDKRLIKKEFVDICNP